MRLRVRWPGATLRPAMLWPELRLGLSRVTPNLTRLKLSSTPRNRPKQAQKGCQEPAVGTSSPPLLIQQKVTGDVGSHGSPRLGHPSHPALNALIDLQPPTCHSISLTRD